MLIQQAQIQANIDSIEKRMAEFSSLTKNTKPDWAQDKTLGQFYANMILNLGQQPNQAMFWVENWEKRMPNNPQGMSVGEIYGLSAPEMVALTRVVWEIYANESKYITTDGDPLSRHCDRYDVNNKLDGRGRMLWLIRSLHEACKYNSMKGGRVYTLIDEKDDYAQVVKAARSVLEPLLGKNGAQFLLERLGDIQIEMASH